MHWLCGARTSGVVANREAAEAARRGGELHRRRARTTTAGPHLPSFLRVLEAGPPKWAVPHCQKPPSVPRPDGPSRFSRGPTTERPTG
jgi:hypothetical protein